MVIFWIYWTFHFYSNAYAYIVKLTTFSLQVQVLVGSASKKPKVATKVSSVFGNESDEDSWSLPEGGSAYKENNIKGPWEREVPCMYHLLCHWLGPRYGSWHHLNSLIIWTNWDLKTAPRIVWTFEGRSYKEICIVLIGFLKLFITIRPCRQTMPFNLGHTFVVCTIIVGF